MNDSRRQIKTGALLSYSAVALSAVAGLVYTPWMVHTIGASDFGLYALATSVTTLFLTDLGVGEAATRFLSKYYAEEDEERIAGFLGTVFCVHFAIALMLAVIFAVVFFNIDAIYANLEASELEKFKDIFLIVSACSVIGVPLWPFKSILSANERFIALRACDLINKACSLLLIVILLLLGFGVFAVVLVNSLCGLAFSFIRMGLAFRLTSARPSFRFRTRGSVKELLGFSGWTLVVQICQRMIFSIMPSILAITMDSWAIAVFGLASQLESYLWTTGNALGYLFMPKVSRILAHDDSDTGIQSLTERVGRIQLHVIGLMVIGFFALGKQFVSCWMGDGYELLAPCAMLLFIPTLFELPATVGNTALVAAGEVRPRAFIYIAMAVVNIVLSVVLSGLIGLIGACLSITIAYLIRAFGLWAMYRSRLGFDPLHFLKSVYLSWLAPAALSFLAGFAMVHLNPLVGWGGLIVNVLVMLVVYVVLCWLLSLSRDEKEFVSSEVLRKRRRVDPEE